METHLSKLIGKAAAGLFAAVVTVKRQDYRFHLDWEPIDRGGCANQSNDIGLLKACGKQCQAIKRALNQQNGVRYLLEAHAKPACRVGLDPALRASWPLEYGFMRRFIHPRLPMPQRTPDKSHAIWRVQREDHTIGPPSQQAALLAHSRPIQQHRWQIADARRQRNLERDASLMQVHPRALRISQRPAHLLIQRAQGIKFILLPLWDRFWWRQQHRLDDIGPVPRLHRRRLVSRHGG